MLASSVFRFNAANNTTGIVNLGGQVQCATMECLPVCTTCEPVPSVAPTSHPTGSPQPNVTARGEANNSPYIIWLVVASLGALVAVVIVMAVEWRRRRRTLCGFRGTAVDELQVSQTTFSNYQRPLLGQEDAHPESVELVGCSVMMSYERSPAPIFVVGRNGLCVTKWSPGMAIAAPALVDPVGSPVSSLPFVNPRDGRRFDRNLRRIFETPAEHDNAQTFVLHLRTRNGHVLLEMRADHLVTEAEPIVVMTGRQVDSDLACMMMAPESAVAPSESKHDAHLNDEFDESGERFRFRSVSEVGSSKDDDANADGDDKDAVYRQLLGDDVYREVASASTISSLTSPTFSTHSKDKSQSTMSSLTTPTLDMSTHSKVKTRHQSDMEPGPAVLNVVNGTRDGAHVRARETILREIRGSGSAAISVVLSPAEDNTMLSFDDESSLDRYIASRYARGSNDSGPDVPFGRSSSDSGSASSHHPSPPLPPPSVS